MTQVDSARPTGRAHGEAGPSVLGGRWISEQRFHAAFEHAPIGMAIVEPGGILTSTNRALSEMLGYNHGELDGEHFSKVTHPDDVALSKEQVQRLRASRDGAEAFRVEKRYLHRDGHTVWARVSVASVRDPAGKDLHFVVQIEDITGQKDAEASARASEEQFRLAFESAASGMALVSPTDGRFLAVNPAGCQMLGYTEEELRGLTIQHVTAPSDREESMARFRSVINGEAAAVKAKLHYLRADGSTAYALISTALMRDPAGEPLQLVANVVDITEQVRAQDQLEAMVASKDELIASVSHELRTPLTAILGFAELLRSETGSLASDERVELVQSIADQTGDLTNIVEDLLVAARADNDTLTVVQVPVDLRAQSAQVVETIGHDHSHPVRLTGQPTRGMGDPARVRQILRNLLSNAFRYGGADIEVSVYESGGYVCVGVSDDGLGVPADQRDRIFEPYQRSGNRTGLTASIGLGLTVSRQLAELMDGRLTYKYESHRSVFELALHPAKES